MLVRVEHAGQLLALIVTPNFEEKGVRFLTPDHFSQQLAVMSHPRGKVITPHMHQPVPREVQYTSEVLVIKKGKIRVDFYSPNQAYIESRVLEAGDVILLVSGGHGFEVLEEVDMIEVKQGPYAGSLDKVLFDPAPAAQIKLKD